MTLIQMPALRFRRKLYPTTNAQSLSDEQLLLLLQLSESDPARRDLFEAASVITNTGVRPHELERLRWNDVNFVRQRMVLKPLKDRWPRYVPFGRRTMQLLIARRERQAESEYVLGDSIWQTLFAVRSQLQEVCKTLGVDGANLRVLRWTFMKRWLDAGLCTHSLGRVLGHRSYFEVGEDGLGPEERFEVDSRLQQLLEGGNG